MSEPLNFTLSKETKDEILSLAGSPEFYQLAIEIIEIHARKNHDYTGGECRNDPFKNFRLTAAQLGCSIIDVMDFNVAQKRSRRQALVDGGVNPKNESQLDTDVDEIVYDMLKVAAYRTLGKQRAEAKWTSTPKEVANGNEETDEDYLAGTGG